MSFIGELKRRNVFRVGTAYVLIAWVIAQVAEFAFETFGAPAWLLQSVVVILMLGLPVVVFFAWAFEITPEGIKPEREVDRSQSITAQTGRKLDIAIVCGLAIVGLLILVQLWWPGRQAPPLTDLGSETAEQSIAVLAFSDLSPDGDQEYFSDGVTEEVLNALVRIPGLKVAGRTSSFYYKGKNEDLRSISTTLNVNHILEGSVRRSGNRLRITAQLIRGADGFHMWSETYDRELTDIFVIQDEIAAAVAGQLALSLGLDDGTVVPDRTESIRAYENYLRARELHRARGKENLDQALLLLNEAIALDPEFAPGWAEIAGVYSNYEAYQDAEARERSHRQWRTLGAAAAERAIGLNPNLGAAHAYLGAFLGYDNEWVPAFDAYDRAIALAPEDPAIADSYAQKLLEVGYAKQAYAMASLAVALDPLAPVPHNTLGRAYAQLGELDRAVETFETARGIDPQLVFPYNNLLRVLPYQDRIDESFATVEDAVENGVYPPEALELSSALRSVWGDEDALRAIVETSPNTTAKILFGGRELAVQTLIATVWERDKPTEIVLFAFLIDGLYEDPRWKDAIRRFGVLDLWRERGFPEFCQPLEGDDFQCVREL